MYVTLQNTQNLRSILGFLALHWIFGVWGLFLNSVITMGSQNLGDRVFTAGHFEYV